jgi:hypothetical protein
MGARLHSRLHRLEQQVLLPGGRCRECPPVCLISEGEKPPSCPGCRSIGDHIVVIEEVVARPDEEARPCRREDGGEEARQ